MPAAAALLSVRGRCSRRRRPPKHNLFSERYRGLLPEDLIDLLTVNKLHYSHATESGALFHLIGALSEFGKLGLTAIANSHEEADRLYAQTLDVLECETAYGR